MSLIFPFKEGVSKLATIHVSQHISDLLVLSLLNHHFRLKTGQV